MSDPLPTPGAGGRIAILGILALGLTLRMWTIANGIPHTVGVDEPEILRRVVAMMKTGDLNPHFFDYGGLTIYVHVAVASVRFALGALSAEPGYVSLDQVWEGSFYLWARLATATIGTLLIYVVYRAGLRWGVPTALVAALVAAVHPSLVREAHFALTDTPLTFFVALTLLATLIASEDGRLRWFILAGLTAGLATATKYNGAVALLMPLTVAAFSPAVRLRAAAALVSVGAGLGAFFAGAPFSLLDLPEFLKGFAHLAQSYSRTTSPIEIADRYLTYTRNAFAFGIGGWTNFVGWPALLLAQVGLIVLLVRVPSGARRAGAFAALVFTGAYFWLISHQSLVYFRYALPLAPIICLSLGAAVSTAADLAVAPSATPKRRRVVWLLLLLPIVPPLWQAASFDWSHRRTGTEEITARWLEKNVPPEDAIVIENATIVLPPGYHWDYTHWLINESLPSYQQRGIKYLVASSEKLDASRNNPNATAAYQQLFAGTHVITVIQRTDDRPGPTLTVLRVPPQ